MKIGDLLKMSYAGASAYGLIVEVIKGKKTAIVYRGSLGFQKWPLQSFYDLEVINESR